jgi:hypothetical protein
LSDTLFLLASIITKKPCESIQNVKFGGAKSICRW